MIFTTVCTIRLCRINDHVWFCASIQECWFNIFWTDIWITLSFCFGFDLMNSLLLWIYRFLSHSSIVWLFHPILSPTISVSSTTRKISPEAASRAHHLFCLDLVMIGCSQHLPFAIFPFFSLCRHALKLQVDKQMVIGMFLRPLKILPSLKKKCYLRCRSRNFTNL